jgi:hypothetical protein
MKRSRRNPWSQQDFLGYFEAFLKAHPELPATRFGTLACADHGFMSRLRHGASNFSLKKYERAVEFIQNYKAGEAGVVTVKLLRQRR